MRKFWVRLTQWEYWPFTLFYFPVFFYFLWLALKRRSIFFFTASNPSIDCGGMFGEKKSDIFELIPAKYIPTTFLIPAGQMGKALEAAAQIGFPLIAKPNIGERGTSVQKVESEDMLRTYVHECKVDFLLQELVEYPIELGVFYVRKPDEERGRVTSIVRKNLLSVEGDGVHSIHELLAKNERAQLTANLQSDFLKKEGSRVPSLHEKVVVEPIGNHCRGTQFLNDNREINDKLEDAMDALAQQIPDFYYGRFDLKCASYESLSNLESFKIMELNGAGAEPAHIYQPGYSLLKAYRDIFWHFKVMADISAQNKKRGLPYWSFHEGYRKWKAYKNHYKKLEA